jgi:hypothetical protein
MCCVAILIAAGLRYAGDGVKEPKSNTFPAPADLDGHKIEHNGIEAKNESLSCCREDEEEIYTAYLNEEHIADIITEIHNSRSSEKVQMVRDLWLIAADMGMADDALETLEYLVQNDSDPAVVKMAAQAEKDLRRLIEMASRPIWLAQSSAAIEQETIGDRLDHSEATLDSNGQDLSELDDLKSDAYSNTTQRSHENGFAQKQALAELVATFDTSDPTGKVELIHQIWIFAADIGVPDNVLESLEYIAAYDPDDGVAEAARHAKKDLESLGIAYNNKFFGLRMDELAEQALWDPSEQHRHRAIQQLSSIRSEAAVDILLQAASDPAVSNRLKAIECLWLSAADGMDKNGDIRADIQWALEDPDQRVSDIAARALLDLKRLTEPAR